MKGRFLSFKQILAALLLMAGLAVVFYPAVSALINERSQTSTILDYEEALLALNDEDKAHSFMQAQAYNQALAGSQESLQDPFGEAEPSSEVGAEIDFLKIGEVMGHIQIPKIGIKVPIYEGTSEPVLQKGIGWMQGTSLPVGGESTHSVLTGHSGLPTAKLFTDLKRLEVGNEFFVRNSTEILAYKVFSIKIIDPHEVEYLSIVPGEDRMTLLTCHPYMINNQRLLIMGERIPYTGQLDELEASKGLFNSMTAAEKDLALIAFAALAFFGLIALSFLLSRRRKKKRKGKIE